MSRAIAVVGKFGLASLTLVDREDLPRRRGEIAIRMRAASINYRDLRMVRAE